MLLIKKKKKPEGLLKTKRYTHYHNLFLAANHKFLLISIDQNQINYQAWRPFIVCWITFQ